MSGKVVTSAADIISALGMQPHPEGGHYVETFRDRGINGRAAQTAIYYLLQEGEKSHWHRVTDASEIWLFHAGAPLRLGIAEPGGASRRISARSPYRCWGASPMRGAGRMLAISRKHGCIHPGQLYGRSRVRVHVIRDGPA